jgi:hypothetical protein
LLARRVPQKANKPDLAPLDLEPDTSYFHHHVQMSMTGIMRSCRLCSIELSAHSLVPEQRPFQPAATTRNSP